MCYNLYRVYCVGNDVIYIMEGVMVLIELREFLKSIYDKEKAEYIFSNLNEHDKNVFIEFLKKIFKEKTKVDYIFNVYQKGNKDYIVMKLERLYMMLLYDLNEVQFNSLGDEEMFEIFDKCFPDEWVFIDSLDMKEDLLLDAIRKNKPIRIKKLVNNSN